jgi:hypothetical protein
LDEKKTPTYWRLAKIINPIVVQNTIDELKVDLLGLKIHIPSQKAREVMQ